MKKEKIVWCYFHHSEFNVPLECAQDLSAQGSVDDAADYWAKEIPLDFSREVKIKGLLEYGAWNREELEELDDHELNMKILFVSIPDGYRRK